MPTKNLALTWMLLASNGFASAVAGPTATGDQASEDHAVQSIDGDGRIAVLNLRPPKLITFAPDGTPAGDLSLAGSEGMNSALGADGTPRQTIRRDAERAGWPFDPDDIERLEPMIESLHPRPNGELWVLAGAGKAPERPDVVGVFDGFDADGRHVRQVELRAPYDPATDRFVIIGDALVVFENIVGTQRGVVVMSGTIAEEAADLDAEELAIARYRF